MLTTKTMALRISLKLDETQYPSAWWDRRTLDRRQPLQLQEEWRYVLARENEGLTWCNTVETLLCSEAYRHDVQPVWRTTITRKGEGEHIFIKVPQLGPPISLFLGFTEVQGGRASLPLGHLAPLWTHVEKPAPITSLLFWTSITNPLIPCSGCPYPSFPSFILDWPWFIWKWWQCSGKYIRNTCIKCRYSVPWMRPPREFRAVIGAENKGSRAISPMFQWHLTITATQRDVVAWQRQKEAIANQTPDQRITAMRALKSNLRE